MGRHSKGRHATPQQRRTVATVQLVDHTGTAHLVTLDAATDGLARGRYITVCGGDVLPAALVARESRQCRLCVPIPAQRPGGTR